MARKKFLRSKTDRYIKLGKRQKKKQKYRKPKGRDNKMREKRKGYPVTVSIGYKKPREHGKKEIKIINNINELLKVQKGEEIILAKGVGQKKRIELANKAKEIGAKISNLNTKKFFERIEREKHKKEQKKKTRDKKTQEVKKEAKKEEEIKTREEKK